MAFHEIALSRTWTAEDIARAICKNLVAQGKLSVRPSFDCGAWEAKFAALLQRCGLNGEQMLAFQEASSLEVLVRRHTQGETWVAQLIEALVALLPQHDVTPTNKDEAYKSREPHQSHIVVHRMSGDAIKIQLAWPGKVSQLKAKLEGVCGCTAERIAISSDGRMLTDADRSPREVSLVVLAPAKSVALEKFERAVMNASLGITRGGTMRVESFDDNFVSSIKALNLEPMRARR